MIPNLPAPFVQRNAFKGRVPRAWIRIAFAALDSSAHEREMLVDTGSPCAIILGSVDLKLLSHAGACSVNSNFGHLSGGWLELQMPDLRLVQPIHCFGSDQVAAAVQRDSPDFAGLVGLPLLRMLEYGGDRNAFWIRSTSAAETIPGPAPAG